MNFFALASPVDFRQRQDNPRFLQTRARPFQKKSAKKRKKAKEARRSLLKHTEPARSRIQDGLKKYSRIVAQARQRGMNEQDTGDIVKAMLGDMLGYDPFFDVTAEISVRGPNADHAVQMDGRLQFLLNIKSVALTPNASHLLRLTGSSAPVYAEWVVLTNADTWICYRLGVGVDRHAEPVFQVSLLDARPSEEKIELFFLLSKEGMQMESLRRHWEQTRVLHPARLAALLLSEDVLNLLRREIQRTASHRVDRETLYEILTRDVLRADSLPGPDLNAPRLPQCFAYVRDPNDPASWRLRYRNADNTPNADMLTLAAGDLSSDPRAIGIPADDLPLVKDRLRQAYHELGVAPADLPDSLRR